jgi:hypothetical protein
MGFLSKDAVTAARKDLETATAAAAKEAQRVEDLKGKIAEFAERAAGIDPDSSGKDFSKATAELASMRATLEILLARQTNANAKAQAAAAALSATELESARSRMKELDAELEARDAKMLDRIRRFRDELAAEIRALADLAAAATEEERKTRPGEMVYPGARRSVLAGENPHRALWVAAGLDDRGAL